MNREINPRMLQSEPLQRCTLAECRAACCLYGAWVDRVKIEDILANAEQISPHMPPETRNPQLWFDDGWEADEFSLSGEVGHTRVLTVPDPLGDTVCIFLRADRKCILQIAALEMGLHPWHFKPFYCILHPLDLDELGRITLDETEALLREPGSCLRPAERALPLAETFAEELRYLLGEKSEQQPTGQG
ncbi:MAG TPA: hypothetical protein DEH22_11695 [Chloroflexi bacterium]|nr:hypothetical protein [Chloroflexota bacterium]